ncbi:MAG: sigma-54-dependent Fis family transcriptional regulator [Phycisphaerales bacterium]|nr:sigma-54-dependent Fis family transcriptional regulator [Phycisphaerales bacterium]
MAKILVIEDEQNLRFTIRRTLSKTKSGAHEVVETGSLREARAALQRQDFDLVLTDVMLGSENGLDLVRELRVPGSGFDGVLVVMTAFGTVESAVAAMREGADDYLQKPLSLEELSIQTDRWLEQRRLARRVKLYERIELTRGGAEEILGSSEPWQTTLRLASRLAGLPLVAPSTEAGGGLPCILLQGETGTGKGVLARYIHARAGELERDARQGSNHAAGAAPAFVHVNCSALPATLVEAELFGHEKGAFTDARETRPGLFEMADGGTIFLDEVSETTLELQAKLLLVVEQGLFRRVGGSKERTVRVRVIAASNQDLDQRVADGRFRRDLLYRLNAFTIKIPSLRDRDGDSALIAEALIRKFSKRYARPTITLGDDARLAIHQHRWPGNVRELVNAVQRAVMLSDENVIGPADLGLAAPAPVGAPTLGANHRATARSAGQTGDLVFDFDHGVHNADEVEKALITQALRHTTGNVSRAAKLIGMQRSSFRYRIERFGLEGFAQEVAKP